MGYNDKNSLVDDACKKLIEEMRSDLRSLYQDITVQVSNKSVDSYLSCLNMSEKSKVSAYVNDLLKKMCTAFSKALQQVVDENDGRKYTDSQVTLMWQLIAAKTMPPELIYMDIRNVQMESANKREAVSKNFSIPALPIVGLGFGIVGLLVAGEISSVAMAWLIRGGSVGLEVVSAYEIYKKVSSAVPVQEPERNVDFHVVTEITDAQYKMNAGILERWIHSVGKRVKEGEPIL